MAARYRRVPLQDLAAEQEHADKKAQAERVERIVAKFHALIWVSLSVALMYFTDFVSLLWFSAEINRMALYLSIGLLSTVAGIFVYLAIWLDIVMKNTVPWELECPNMIPIASGCSVASFIAFIFALWPVWGLLTPLFVTFLLLGVIFSMHFIPWPFKSDKKVKSDSPSSGSLMMTPIHNVVPTSSS